MKGRVHRFMLLVVYCLQSVWFCLQPQTSAEIVNMVFSWVSAVIREHVFFFVSSTLDLTFFLSIFQLSCTAVTVAWLTELLWRCASCMQTCLERSLSLFLFTQCFIKIAPCPSFPSPIPPCLLRKEQEREIKRWRTTLVVRWVSGVAHRSLFQPGLALWGIMCVSASFSTYCLKSRERSWLRGEACGGRERGEEVSWWMCWIKNAVCWLMI